MKNKTTTILENELKDAKKIEDFLNVNKSEFIKKTFTEYLYELMKEKGLNKSDVIEQSGLDSGYAYHIFAGRKNPTRNKILALAIAMKLTTDETQRLLYYANAGILYVRNSWDSVILYALENKLSVIETNLLLDKLGETKILD